MADPYETEVDIAAPVDEVFRYLTDPAAMVSWMGQHAHLEPQPDGRFEVDINGVPVRGRYLVVDRPRQVVVSWGVAGRDDFPPGMSRVEFRLSATPTGTHLRLIHSDLPDDLMPRHRGGWEHFLPRLALAATGTDPGGDPWEQTA